MYLSFLFLGTAPPDVGQTTVMPLSPPVLKCESISTFCVAIYVSMFILASSTIQYEKQILRSKYSKRSMLTSLLEEKSNSSTSQEKSEAPGHSSSKQEILELFHTIMKSFLMN